MKKTTLDYIQKLVPESLGAVSCHSHVDWIERLVAKNFPVHLSVHHISDAKEMPLDYVQSHHHSYPELNIIISDDNSLQFKVELGDDVHYVESPSSIWIPAGMDHSTVAISGSGYFVCMILKEHEKSTYESLTEKSE